MRDCIKSSTQDWMCKWTQKENSSIKTFTLHVYYRVSMNKCLCVYVFPCVHIHIKQSILTISQWAEAMRMEFRSLLVSNTYQSKYLFIDKLSHLTIDCSDHISYNINQFFHCSCLYLMCMIKVVVQTDGFLCDKCCCQTKQVNA